MATAEDAASATSATPAADPRGGLEQTLALLQAKDDTSRFAGLSLLRKLLDANETLRTDSVVVVRCWEAVSPKFLVRLLKARPTAARSEEDAKSLVELAVAIIHIFWALLSEDDFGVSRVIAFTHPLVEALTIIGAATRTLAWQILTSFASVAGAAPLLIDQAPFSSLLSARSIDEHATRQLGLILRACHSRVQHDKAQIKTWDDRICQMIAAWQLDYAVDTLEACSEAVDQMTIHSQPGWLDDLIRLVQNVMLSKPTSRARALVARLSASLFRNADPSLNMPSRLFTTQQPAGAPRSEVSFAYLFINLVLIEIRSTIPSLMEQLASPLYTTTSLSLAANYDILTAFIAYLIQSTEDEDEDITDVPQAPRLQTPLVLPAAHLLTLRRSINETLSLTLEYLRDRWDAAITGAPGLDPATYAPVRPAEMSSQPLALTWDNPTISPGGDPLVLAGLRALALWCREDGNATLLGEVGGLVDVLLSLAKEGGRGGVAGFMDARDPVLMLLAVVLPEDEGAVAQILELGGWDVLAGLLEKALEAEPPPAYTQDLVRCLLAIVESPLVPRSREAWMGLVAVVAKARTPSTSYSVRMANLAAAYQLAVALVVKAPQRVQRLYRGEGRMLVQKSEEILRAGPEDDVKDGLIEVIAGLSE